MRVGSLSIVGGRGDVSTVTRPVSVDVTAGFWQQLIRVSSKVIPLGLKEKNVLTISDEHQNDSEK